MNTLTTTPADLTVTRVAEGVYSVAADGEIRVVFVDPQDGPECLCDAFQTTGSCAHATAADEEMRIEAMEAAHEAMEEARFLMTWTSDVHHHPDADLFLLTDAA